MNLNETIAVSSKSCTEEPGLCIMADYDTSLLNGRWGWKKILAFAIW